MSPANGPWRLDSKEHLLEVRQRWVARDAPSPKQVAAFHDWLLDAMLDPSKAGQPDSEVEGIWIGRPGLGVSVLFGLDAETMRISIFEIGSS